MALSTSANKVIHSGNGVATSFAYTFPILEASHLSVIYTDAGGNAITLSSSLYSATGIGGLSGGAVTYPLSGSPLASGETLTLMRIVPLTQTTVFSNQGGYYPEIVEARFDRVYMALQQLDEEIGRATLDPPSVQRADVVETLAALKALTTRPAAVLVKTGQAAGVWQWVSGSSMTADDGIVVTPTSGAAGRYKRVFDGPVYVTWYGAVSDFNGSTGTDNTAAFLTAIATNEPVYVPGNPSDLHYLVENMLTLNNKQVMFGDGVTASVIGVKATFNLSALGVIRLGTGETGAELRGVGITFIQPDTAVRANLVAYPPALYAQNAPRFTVENVRISRAMTVIDARGNCGGAWIEGLEASFFDYAVRLDGSLDTVWIERVNLWPYGLSANNQTIMFDAATVGIDCGRVDDFFFSSIQGTRIQTLLHFHASYDTVSLPNGKVTSVGADGGGLITMSAGNVEINGWHCRPYNAQDYIIRHTGGKLTVGPVDVLEVSVASTDPLIWISNPTGGYPHFNMSTLAADLAGFDATLIHVDTDAQGDFSFGNVFINRQQDIAYTKPSIHIEEGYGHFGSIRATPKGMGAGVLIQHDAGTISWGHLKPASWTVNSPTGFTGASVVGTRGSMVQFGSDTTSGGPTRNVGFAKTYSAAPKVFVQCATLSGSFIFDHTITAISTTGFSVEFGSGAGAGTAFYWFAIGPE